MSELAAFYFSLWLTIKSEIRSTQPIISQVVLFVQPKCYFYINQNTSKGMWIESRSIHNLDSITHRYESEYNLK